MPITEFDARSAIPGNKPYKLWDGAGLYLAIQTSGAKIWRLKCRSGGCERVICFGRYPQISLAEARIRRDDALQLLAEGRDAWSEIKAHPASSLTFEAVARAWHQGRHDALTPFYSARLLQRLELDIFPILGGQIITRITPIQVLEALRRIEERGALTICLQLKRTTGKIFRYAIAQGWLDRDPTQGLHDALKPRPRTKHHRRLGVGELPAILCQIADYNDLGRLHHPHVVRDALRFTILTWARTSQTRNATWQEFEELEGESPLWRVPAERMKCGREHLIPLSRQAAQLVRDLQARSQSAFLFPGRTGDKPISQNAMIGACYRLGYRRQQTVHGFRSIASTWANERQSYSPDWIEMALAHYVEDVRGAYNSALYLAPRKRMLQDWADHVARLGLLPESASSAHFSNQKVSHESRQGHISITLSFSNYSPNSSI